MNAKIVIILGACLWYADACNRHNNSNCSGSASCNHKYKRQVGSGNQGITTVYLMGKQYTVELPENPCSFNTYDVDSDGIISHGELFGVLGIDSIPTSVVRDLDAMTDHGIVTEEEFHAKVSQIIPACNRSF